MTIISEVEFLVVELNGFLNAVRCMLGVKPRSYGAVFIEKDGRSLNDVVQEAISGNITGSSLSINSESDFKHIQQLLNKYIYSRLKNIEANALDQLDWSLVEYYGLISTAEKEGGDWNRLVGQKHTVLEYSDDTKKDGAVFFVEYEKFVVMTCLGEDL